MRDNKERRGDGTATGRNGWNMECEGRWRSSRMEWNSRISLGGRGEGGMWNRSSKEHVEQGV